MGVKALYWLGILASLFVSGLANAHPGGLDRFGCHHDRRNGGYHCHNGSVLQPAPSRPTREPERRAEVPRSSSETPASVRERETEVSSQTYAAIATLPPPAVPPHAQSNLAIASPIIGNAKIVDGDTLDIGDHKIRLYGIDAFEADQRCGPQREVACGKEATETLKSIAGGARLICVDRGIDKYGRTLAVCRLGINDINAQMVRTGWAVAYREYANDYAMDEDEAYWAKRGAWASSFVWPWEYRKETNERTPPAPSPR